MSAHICNDSVFSTLAAFAALTIDKIDAQATADVLKKENYRSVNFRYKRADIASPADMSTAAAQTNRAELLELVREYDYQACECNDYNESAAARLVQAIRSNVIAYVPSDTTTSGPGLIGRAVYRARDGRRGYVVGESVSEYKSYTLGAKGMQADTAARLVIVWLPSDAAGGLSKSEDSLSRAQPMLESSYNWPAITAGQTAALLRDYDAELSAANAARAAARAEQDHAESEFQSRLSAVMPADCKGVIIAELQQNESDSMSDYFHNSTSRVLILGFSAHNRDLFAEMRKACAAADLSDLPAVALLADPDQGEEHREKYSGGRGFYIGARGVSCYSGWQLRKVRAWGKNALSPGQVPAGELRLPKTKAAGPALTQGPAVAGGVSVRLNSEKQGIEVTFSAKPDSEARDSLKAHGFRWSRAGGFWYAKQSAARLAFVEGLAAQAAAAA